MASTPIPFLDVLMIASAQTSFKPRFDRGYEPTRQDAGVTRLEPAFGFGDGLVAPLPASRQR